MRKKRSLAGVIVDENQNKENAKVVLPAASRTITTKSQTEIVRGTEFLVDPLDCRPWRFHNRDTVWMNVEKCQDLISSIRKNGQKVPIFARKLENDLEGKNWEIIAGRRRWFACNYLKQKVRVKAVEASDRECAILMNLENKDRNDISEFEDAISYKQQLDASLFDSQDEMASALDLKKSKLSKMLSAAKIINYKEIMALFEDITLLKINPIYSLVVLLEKNANYREVIINAAKELKDKIQQRKTHIKPNVIINELIKAINKDEKKFNVARSYKVDDKILFKSIQPTYKKFVFEFNRSNFSNIEPERLKALVLEALDEFI
ncbi:ParB/RepB/Spo0J family partition protein [Legionella gresilensis]|uniref:ParB/RepB/Spo0J family partition protein n=1 Tax=Legionella gresilensis TaxID=91823 RepID=UPI0013EF7EAA|nr:ParB/RepB/Spo0J family partition protein [Legionella gresilensis]